jgi:dynein heavy chain 2
LTELSSSSSNILENKELIKSLNDSKEKSKIVEESLEESRKLQQIWMNNVKCIGPLPSKEANCIF